EPCRSPGRGVPRSRHRPPAHHARDEPPLRDGLLRQQRHGGARRRGQALHHRLPLRRARAPGGRGLRARAGAAGLRGGARGRLARGRAPARLRGSARLGQAARAPARGDPRAHRAGAGRRHRGSRAGRQGTRRARRHPEGRTDRRRRLRLDRRARPGRAHRARGGAHGRARDAPARRRGAELPVDRRVRRARGAAARRAARCPDRRRHPGDHRHGRARRRLLLRLHPHLRHRGAARVARAHPSGRPRGTAGGAGGRTPGAHRTRRRRGGARADRRRRPWRALRPRPRPWRGTGHPRGAATRPQRHRSAARRQRGDGGARRLRAGPLGRPDRGPGRPHRRRPRGPQRVSQDADRRRL
ncbi:MAG: Aminopeptidase YpdF (MP-, MA-, MS-, AP-, NP-specific), partial [uncultured Solirubrobacteraceae bacterium]